MDEEWKLPEEDRQVPLKGNGELMSVIDGLTYVENLRWLLEDRPDRFLALRKLIDGRSDGVTEAQINDLIDMGYMQDRDKPDPKCKLVMEAACRETSDGPCLVAPFDCKNPADAAFVELMEQEARQCQRNLEEMYPKHQSDSDKSSRFLRDLFREEEDDDNNQGKGRPR